MEIFYLTLFFIVGMFFGSFFTVVGFRLPRGEDFIISRSRCDECKHELSLLEMIPILSFLFLGRKCRYCKSPINPLSTYMEFFTGLLFALSYYSFGFTKDLYIALGIVSLFSIILVSDLNYLIIPDQVLVFFSIYFICIQVFRLGIIDTIYHIGFGVFLFFVMYSIMILGNKIYKKETLGGGDVKLMFVFGLVLDPLLGIVTVFLASFFALPLSLFLYFVNNEKVVPFGPFLLLAFLFIFFVKISPTDIINWLNL